MSQMKNVVCQKWASKIHCQKSLLKIHCQKFIEQAKSQETNIPWFFSTLCQVSDGASNVHERVQQIVGAGGVRQKQTRFQNVPVFEQHIVHRTQHERRCSRLLPIVLHLPTPTGTLCTLVV